MSDFPNIIFDESLLTVENSKIHIHNLEIASLNLNEFNRRNPEEEDIQFEYVDKGDGFSFERKRLSPYIHYSDNYFQLNWFVTMSGKPQWHEEWVVYYPDRMYSYFLEFFHSYGQDEIDLFVSLFKDFIPKEKS